MKSPDGIVVVADRRLHRGSVLSRSEISRSFSGISIFTASRRIRFLSGFLQDLARNTVHLVDGLIMCTGMRIVRAWSRSSA